MISDEACCAIVSVIFVGVVFTIVWLAISLPRKSRGRLRKRIEDIAECSLATKNLISYWQLEKNVTYRYERGFRARLQIEQAMGIYYLVAARNCKREMMFVVKDDHADYIKGDYLDEGFYKCVGRYVGEFKDSRLLERIELPSDLGKVNLKMIRL